MLINDIEKIVTKILEKNQKEIIASIAMEVSALIINKKECRFKPGDRVCFGYDRVPWIITSIAEAPERIQCKQTTEGGAHHHWPSEEELSFADSKYKYGDIVYHKDHALPAEMTVKREMDGQVSCEYEVFGMPYTAVYSIDCLICKEELEAEAFKINDVVYLRHDVGRTIPLTVVGVNESGELLCDYTLFKEQHRRKFDILDVVSYNV